MLYKKNNILSCCFLFFVIYFASACTKTAIKFGSEGTEGDPNITTIDTFSVYVSTLQVDSFSTSNSGYLIAGSHRDPALGYIESKSFLQLTAPSLDLRNTNCVFDSIAFYATVSSGYMGDSSVPFTLNLHELIQAMDEDELSSGYNVSNVNYNNAPLASKTFSIRPSAKKQINIRLADNFGKNIFRMFKTNSDTLTNNEKFKLFFKGICLSTATGNNAIYYFEKDSSLVIKLHYTIAGAIPEHKTTDFTISSEDLQFNSFTYNKAGTNIAGFIPKTKQVISSLLSNNTGYLHYNSGLFPKISFGNLLSIKELHPYIQVITAHLEITPQKGSYGVNSIYTLPPSIELRLTDDDNYITGNALTYSDGTQAQVQNGSLYIDGLYGENTSYVYDVTAFVNTILSEGAFSKRALIMYPSNANSNDQRLLINNNTGENPIKLKLSILGL